MHTVRAGGGRPCGFAFNAGAHSRAFHRSWRLPRGSLRRSARLLPPSARSPASRTPPGRRSRPALRRREARSGTALLVARPGHRHRLKHSTRGAPLRSPGGVRSAGGRDRRPRAPAAPRGLPDSSRSGRRRGGEPPRQRPAERPPAARHPGSRSSPAAARPALPDCRGGPAPPGRLSERRGRRRGHGTAAEPEAGRVERRLPRIGPAARAAILGLRAGSPAVFAAAWRAGRAVPLSAPQLPRPALLVRRGFDVASSKPACPRLVLVVIPERCFARRLLKEKAMLFMSSDRSPFK